MITLQKEKWEQVKLADICDLINGRAYKADELLDEGTPILRVGNFFTNEKWYYSNLVLEDKKYCDDGDLLYAWSASFVAKIWKGGKVIFHYHIWKVVVSDKVNKEFLYYVLENETEKIKIASHGTTMPHITKTDMEKHPIPLPPLEEQQQIAALFQSLDHASEAVETQAGNVKRLKMRLLRELFGEQRRIGTYVSPADFEPVTFATLAFNISERVDPKQTDLKTYVGLEHLDPDNLKIERTGTPADVIGTKLKIYQGDIIFGKRRAYQRKVAVAHFDGIASAHSMILRANEHTIEKDFLPFFLQSDAFMNRAVQISEGSLSPTIKWKNLAAQEFFLPKKDKQATLAQLFQQFDATLTQLTTQQHALKQVKHTLLQELLSS